MVVEPPSWKMCSSKWVHLPQFSGWKYKTNWNHHHPWRDSIPGFSPPKIIENPDFCGSEPSKTCALIRKTKQWEKLLANNRQQLKESHPTPIISHPTPICSSETIQFPLLSLGCQRIALPTCRHHGTIRHEGSRVSMAPTWGARNTRAPISTPLGVLRIQFRKACTIGYWWLAEKSTCGCHRPFFVSLCNGWSWCGVQFM